MAPSRTSAPSLVIAALAAATALAGLLVDGVYRDNAFVTAGWFGNDLVTLAFAAPLLAVAARGAQAGSRTAALVELGMLHFMLYNYAFYLFGCALNMLFLSYVALFTLPLATLAFRLGSGDAARLVAGTETLRGARFVGGYLVLWAAVLGGLWVAQSLRFAFTGELPAIMEAVGHPAGDTTNLVAALDLSLIVPPVALAGAWLLRNDARGPVLAALVSVSGSSYTLVLTASSLSAARRGFPDVLAQVPLWVALTLLSGAAAAWLLRRAPAAPGTAAVTSSASASAR